MWWLSLSVSIDECECTRALVLLTYKHALAVFCWQALAGQERQISQIAAQIPKELRLLMKVKYVWATVRG